MQFLVGHAVAQARFSSWSLGLNPRPVIVGFMVDEVAFGQVFLRDNRVNVYRRIVGACLRFCTLS